LHPLVVQTLIRRGITTAQAARAFLSPDHYNPTPASELPGLSAAADRVEAAIRARESICVWGDFDVDGQTSTTILVSTLQDLGADVTYHIPVRARESHGVNIPFLTEIIEHGAKLILTCDTGISAHAAVDYARGRGVDVVITDHHDLPHAACPPARTSGRCGGPGQGAGRSAESLPEAAAITNPKLLPAGHRLSTLPGVGVAYKLAEELYARFDRAGEEEKCLDLAALGIVADLALLYGDSRYLLQRGLYGLRKTQRLGLKIMMEMAELVPAHLTEEHIGFALAPRLNALGRLSDANPAVELLTTHDPARARLLATQLEGLNAQRQLLTRQVTLAAEAQLRADPTLLAQPIIVLSHPSWPGGVIGIAASHLVERYHRPVILFSAPAGEAARGSARSIEGVNITAAIAAQQDMLLNYGGHPMAAGLSLEAEKLPAFRKAIAKTVAGMIAEAEIEPKLEINGWFALADLDLTLSEKIEQLAPFGPGNEKLILATHNLTLQSAAEIGRNKEHLKFTVVDEQGNTQTVLWWNGGGEELPDLTTEEGSKFDLAYTLRASDFRGVRQVTLEFVDLRLIEEKPVQVTKPAIEVIDYRGVENPVDTFACTCAGTSERLNVETACPGGQARERSVGFKRSNIRTMTWAEGSDKKVVGGKGRNELSPTDALVIWTTPPGSAELRQAIDKARPEKIYLFAVNPGADEPKAFLERLAGLVKYAVNQRGGSVTLAELAAATAQREATVRLGLEWLAAGGYFGFSIEEQQLKLTAQTGPANPYLQQELFTAIKGLLAETAAYRAFFTRADCATILPPI
jgi:single-stranded-DNA-specific exonuclease